VEPRADLNDLGKRRIPASAERIIPAEVNENTDTWEFSFRCMGEAYRFIFPI
jgi:hypothetical protein